MEQVFQFVVILGSLLVLVVGAVGVPIMLGVLGASRLKAIRERLADLEEQNHERLAEVEERLEMAEWLLRQHQERRVPPPAESTKRLEDGS